MRVTIRPSMSPWRMRSRTPCGPRDSIPWWRSVAESVVELRGVRKRFNVGQPNETEVLHGVDLTVGKGDFCA